MALTDIVIRNAKPKDKPYKLGDALGLFLLVQPTGGKLWRLKYRVDGKEKSWASALSRGEPDAEASGKRGGLQGAGRAAQIPDLTEWSRHGRCRRPGGACPLP